MNGILNILKPPGMTSFDVVAWLRRLTKIKKIGHTGTLDPMACGVLPICIGNATKSIEYLVDKDKVYRAELTLGITTDTQDAYGKIISREESDASDKDIYDVFQKFTGKLVQTPPMYSALKVEGKKLYELARQGITIERVAREIEIFKINILDIERKESIKILFDVHCSKGTYIRTLCDDIGQSLGCGAHMSFLLRKRAGPFESGNAFTIEEIEKLAVEGNLESCLTCVDKAFSSFKSVVLDQDRLRKLINGITVEIKPKAVEADIVELNNGLVRVYSDNGNFIAVGELRRGCESITLKSKKLFI